MKATLKIIFKEYKKFIKNPKNILKIFFKNQLYTYINRLIHKIWFGEKWIQYRLKTGGFIKRYYHSYDDYIKHQKLKSTDIERITLAEYDIKYRKILKNRLIKLKTPIKGKTVLCLGARIGTEVKSFLDIGCLAIGIDINPKKRNQYVLYGDFHNIQFPKNCFDLIFTNSLDHVFNIDKLINEIKRVLKPTGILIIEAIRLSI